MDTWSPAHVFAVRSWGWGGVGDCLGCGPYIRTGAQKPGERRALNFSLLSGALVSSI